MIQRLLLLTTGLMVATPSVAFAQAAPPASETPRRWELEAYGGLSLGRFSGGGTLTIPAAGAPIATSSPVFPSWSVPSWFFGDGAAFLNNVAAEFGLTNRITPLDEWLKPLAVNDSGHVMAGLRIRRPLRTPWTLELGMELSTQGAGLSADLVAGLHATSSTFQATFNELLSTGPFTQPVVTAGSTGAPGTSRNVALTAALNTPMKSFGSFTSYAVAGGGVVLPMGDALTTDLSGNYRFRIAGAVPIDESDVLTVRYRERLAFVAVAGGGVRRAFSDRFGVQIDARIMAGPATTTVDVDSAPVIVTASPAGFIESFTYPNLQFSNTPSTGRRSTLGAPGLNGVEVFSGGWLLRGRVTVGVYWRF